jgi:hypothetical protein
MPDQETALWWQFMARQFCLALASSWDMMIGKRVSHE